MRIRFHFITLFQETLTPYLNASILGRASKNKKVSFHFKNPRDFVKNKWGKVDERPYGGGPGMVLSALPVVQAVEKAISLKKGKKAIIWFSPSGKQFTNKDAEALLSYGEIVLVCGRYEGIDERAKRMLSRLGVVKEYAVGEAIYTGGEIPALAIADAVTRRVKGVLGKESSIEECRVASSAVYTRPECIMWKGKKYLIPKVLKTGNHASIDSWKKSVLDKKKTVRKINKSRAIE